MWIKRQVVMLPTKEKADGVTVIDSFRTIKPNMFIIHNNLYQHEDYKAYHIYILSDEEIKEGDWVLCSNGNIKQITKDNTNDKFIENWKKIIATTSLLDRNYNLDRQLPQPSQDFIKVFVEEYNKGNVIEWVDVEYEKVCANCNKYLSAHRFGVCPNKLHLDKTTLVDTYEESVNADYALKIDPKDNTISIRKIKDSWNREEVIEIINTISEKIDFESATQKTIDKWIEENL